MFGLEESKEMWMWAYVHPILFTIIKLGTPSLYAVILFAGSKIISSILGKRRR
jgi:hypothetical protein